MDPKQLIAVPSESQLATSQMWTRHRHRNRPGTPAVPTALGPRRPPLAAAAAAAALVEAAQLPAKPCTAARTRRRTCPQRRTARRCCIAAADAAASLPHPGGDANAPGGSAVDDGSANATAADQTGDRKGMPLDRNEGDSTDVRPPQDPGGARVFSQLHARAQRVLDIGSFALPLAAQNVLGYSLNVLSSSLIGRLGTAQLSASTLGNSAYSISGLSLVWGGAAGLETLCGQAYGAGDPRLMRLVLLRAVLVSWAVCLLVVALWWRAEALLTALGQSPNLVATAATYLQSLAPSLFAYSLSECLQVYLVVQGLTHVTTAAKTAVTVLGPLYYWGCMFGLEQGLLGAGYAYALCKATNAALLLGWMLWRAVRPVGRDLRVASKTADAAVAADGGGSGPLPHNNVDGNSAISGNGTSPGTGSSGEVRASARGGAAGGGEGYSHLRLDPHLEMLTSPLAATAAATIREDPNPLPQPPSTSRSPPPQTRQQQQQQQQQQQHEVTGSGDGGSSYGRLRALAAAAWWEFSEAADPRGCREYIRFGAPAVVTCCLECWAYEALVIMAGWLPNADLAVGCLGICLTISGWCYMVPQAVATATCARVAGALGAGDAAAAKRHFQSGAWLVVLSQSVLCAALLPQVSAVARLFCPDPAAAALTATVLPITAVGLLGDGLNCVLNNGVLRACGRQALVARLHLGTYWGCGLPAAYVAAFQLGWGVTGFVGALGASSLVQSLVMGAIISRWNWQVEVRNSRELLATMARGSRKLEVVTAEAAEAKGAGAVPVS